MMRIWGYVPMGAVVLLALILVLDNRRRTRRTLESMNRMLDLAMQGDFSEDSFDETLLSALESKLAHYLAASAVSARNVQVEKDKLKALMLYLFDTPNPEAEAAVESYLAQLAASADSPLRYEGKATHRAHFREFRMTFVILGGLLCAIIAVVGILNFFNAMMTSILSRRREFAVLQAVGMTGGQLKAMLVEEGLLYTLGSGEISLILSAIVNPMAGRLLENAYWFYTYRYTIAPVLLAVPVFALLGCAIPTLMYRHAAKQSIVQRLREAEQ